jgi:hypothetical protein
MKRNLSVLALAIGFAGCSSALPFSGLLDSLGGLGLSSDQLIAGAGTLLNSASKKLSPADWGKVSNAIPGADALMKSAGDLTGLTAGSSSADAVAAMNKLGVSPDQMTKVGQGVADYAGKAGGESVKNSLLNAWK